MRKQVMIPALLALSVGLAACWAGQFVGRRLRRSDRKGVAFARRAGDQQAPRDAAGGLHELRGRQVGHADHHPRRP